jgi:hypothetical protein
MKIRSILLISTIITLVISSLSSCSQQEGIGGNSHIKGKIMVNYYNDDFSTLLTDEPVEAKDEDVFLIFGNDSTIGDKVTTSFTGDFKFEYLWPGNYKLYYYSEDTTGLSPDKVEIVKNITLKKNETLDLGNLIIKKKLKWNEGSSFITGKVLVNYWNDDYSLLLSDQPVPAKDEDIFLMFGNSTAVGKDTKTSFTGDFGFDYLLAGNYKLYYYSDDTSGISTKKVEIVKDISLKNNETVKLDTLIINKSLKWDEGTSSIKGTVFIINYKNSTSYPDLEIKDITPAQDQDIYIQYGNHQFYDKRIATSSDGTFMFPNLIKGKYKIFLYSEDVTGGTAMDVIQKEIEITKDHQDIVIGETIYIKKL